MRIRTVALLVALAAAACARTDAGAANEVTVVPLDGQVTVLEDGDATVLEEPTTVDPGARVATSADGRARVLLAGERTLELAPDAEVGLPSSTDPEVVRGSVLVNAPAEGILVDAGGADLEARRSVFRIDRGFSVILAVYRGEVDVLGSGLAPVPSLRQATILEGGGIQSGHRPLQVRPDDAWDIELLGPAIDLGLKLVGLERGLTRQIPDQGGPRAVGAALQRDLPRALVTAALESLDAARAAVAAVLAEEAARLDGSTPTDALSDIVELQRDGAHWIVVVARWGLAVVEGDLLQRLAALTSAIARAVAPPPTPPASVAGGGNDTPGGGGATVSGGTTDPGPTGTGGGGSGGGGRGSGGGKSDGGGGGTDGTGGGGGGDAEEPQCENEIDCVIQEIIPGSDGPLGG